MAAEDRLLHELCQKVGTGDAEALQQFREEVTPLVSIIARRSLRVAPGGNESLRCQDDRRLRPAPAGSCDDAALNLALRICHSVVCELQARTRRPRGDTLAVSGIWRPVRPSTEVV